MLPVFFLIFLLGEEMLLVGEEMLLESPLSPVHNRKYFLFFLLD